MIKARNSQAFSLEKWRDEEGATAVEYGLLVGLIAVFLITAMSTLGTSVADTFDKAACKVSGGTWTTQKTCTPAP